PDRIARAAADAIAHTAVHLREPAGARLTFALNGAAPPLSVSAARTRRDAVADRVETKRIESAAAAVPAAAEDLGEARTRVAFAGDPAARPLPPVTAGARGQLGGRQPGHAPENVRVPGEPGPCPPHRSGAGHYPGSTRPLPSGARGSGAVDVGALD